MKELNRDIPLKFTPYSGQANSCDILGRSGLIYHGLRIENISFPLTIPAIQSAICSCYANNDKPESIIRSDKDSNIPDRWQTFFGLKTVAQVPEKSRVFNPVREKPGNIFTSLQNLCKNSVSDQSGFPVSALLRTEKGFVPGVNIEFKEWNIGLCAERVALSRAFAAGCQELNEIHIYAPKADFISPCGACRQVLFEWMPDQQVILYHNQESTSRHFVSELLPHGFKTNSLKK